MVSEVGEPEGLLATELPAQLDLPLFQGHVCRLLEPGDLGLLMFLATLAA
jgi:hypothetical protein